MDSRIALLLALTALAPTVHAGDKPIPIEAFVEKQQFSQPRLAPDGKHLAVNVRMMRNDRMIPTMTVYSLPDLKVISTIILPLFEIPVSFRWVSNRRLIVNKGIEVGNRERPQATGEVVAIDFDGAKSEYLFGYQAFHQSSRGTRYGDDYGYGFVTHVPRSRDGHVFLGAHFWELEHSMLYDINSQNSTRKLLADIAMPYLSYKIQNDSRPRFAAGEDEQAEPILFRLDDTSGQWNKVDKSLLGASYRPFGFTHDDSAAYVAFSADGGPEAIVSEDLKTGKRTVLASDPVGNISKMEYSAEPAVPFAFATHTGVPKARYVDDTSPDATLHKLLSAAFPDAYVNFINFTDDGQRLLFGVSSDRDPGSYYLFDKKTGKAELLLSNMPLIDPDEMAERRPIVFTARDGMKMTGYMTVPKNVGKKKLPMVLLPHGGPFEEADDWFFDSDAQFLASRGYAVLQVNFRGSGGRGPAFVHAGYREYGGKMMNDLIDGVKWANAQPDIDSTRVCVYGANFGGYAALMLPVREPEMFKCSVGMSGRYDLPSKYKDEWVQGNVRAKNYLIKTLGQDTAVLEANSPTHLAAQIHVPVLMAHGGRDKTTTLNQAKMMRKALIEAGNAPEWMEVSTEGHGFYDSEYQKQFYQKLEVFLAKHIGK